MKIKVKDPETGDLLELEANPAELDKQEGWSVILPSGQSIFITFFNGRWAGRNNKIANHELIDAIGKAINPSSLSNPLPKDEGADTPEEPEKNLTEGEVDDLVKKVDETEYKKKFN